MRRRAGVEWSTLEHGPQSAPGDAQNASGVPLTANRYEPTDRLESGIVDEMTCSMSHWEWVVQNWPERARALIDFFRFANCPAHLRNQSGAKKRIAPWSTSARHTQRNAELTRGRVPEARATCPLASFAEGSSRLPSSSPFHRAQRGTAAAPDGNRESNCRPAAGPFSSFALWLVCGSFLEYPSTSCADGCCRASRMRLYFPSESHYSQLRADALRDSKSAVFTGLRVRFPPPVLARITGDFASRGRPGSLGRFCLCGLTVPNGVLRLNERDHLPFLALEVHLHAR
jgi:hypothetical protein